MLHAFSNAAQVRSTERQIEASSEPPLDPLLVVRAGSSAAPWLAVDANHSLPARRQTNLSKTHGPAPPPRRKRHARRRRPSAASRTFLFFADEWRLRVPWSRSEGCKMIATPGARQARACWYLAAFALRLAAAPASRSRSACSASQTRHSSRSQMSLGNAGLRGSSSVTPDSCSLSPAPIERCQGGGSGGRPRESRRRR